MIFLSWLVFAILVAVWANNLNRSGVGFFFLSVFLSPVIAAIILLLVGKWDGDKRKCPQCAEHVQLDALICRYCGHEFEGKAKTKEADWQPVAIMFVMVLFFGILYFLNFR